MTAEWLPAPAAGSSALNAWTFMVVLLFVLLASSQRRRAAGGIRLAAPAFVPLAPDSARQIASELGAAVGELIDAERRKGDG